MAVDGLIRPARCLAVSSKVGVPAEFRVTQEPTLLGDGEPFLLKAVEGRLIAVIGRRLIDATFQSHLVSMQYSQMTKAT